MSERNMGTPRFHHIPDAERVLAKLRIRLGAKWRQADPADIDDAVDYGMAETEERLEAHQIIDNPGSYAYRVAWRWLYKRIHIDTSYICYQYDETSVNFESVVQRNSDVQPTPEEIYLAKERAKALKKALDELPEEERLDFLDAVLHDVPQEELARRANVTYGSMRNRITRTRQKLSTKLRQRGIMD